MKNILERFSELCCPACRASTLELAHETITCGECGENYRVVDGKYPCMLPRSADISLEEVDVQNQVASEYQNTRYRKPWSRKYHQWWTDLMISQVDVSGRILDNGCGIGELSDALPEADITGLDISTEMVRIAGKEYDRTLIGDSQILPFNDESFDTIMARSLIHHLPDPGKGLAEMARVLRPGGEVVSIDTNSSLLSSLPRILAYKGEHFSEEHKNLHRNELLELFGRYFEVENKQFFGYVAYPVLGFPDLMDLFKYFPFKSISYKTLMVMDGVLARIPLIRSQAWGLLIKGRKR